MRKYLRRFWPLLGLLCGLYAMPPEAAKANLLFNASTLNINLQGGQFANPSYVGQWYFNVSSTASLNGTFLTSQVANATANIVLQDANGTQATVTLLPPIGLVITSQTAGSLGGYFTWSGTLPAAFDPTTAVLQSNLPVGFPCCGGALTTIWGDGSTHVPQNPANFIVYDNSNQVIFSAPDLRNSVAADAVFINVAPYVQPPPPPPPSFVSIPSDNRILTQWAPQLFGTYQCVTGSKPPIVVNQSGYQHLVLCPGAGGRAKATAPMTLSSTPLYFLSAAPPASSPLNVSFSYHDLGSYAAGIVPDSYNTVWGSVGAGCFDGFNLRLNSGQATQCIWMTGYNYLDYDNNAVYAWATFVGSTNNARKSLNVLSPGYWPGKNCAGIGSLPPGYLQLQGGIQSGASTYISSYFNGGGPFTTASGHCANAGPSDVQMRLFYPYNLAMPLYYRGNPLGQQTVLIDAGNGNGPEWPLALMIDNYYGSQVKALTGSNCSASGPACCAVPPDKCNFAIERIYYVQYLGSVAFEIYTPAGLNSTYNCNTTPDPGFATETQTPPKGSVSGYPWAFCSWASPPNTNIIPAGDFTNAGGIIPVNVSAIVNGLGNSALTQPPW